MAHTHYAEISRDHEAGIWYVSGTDVPGLVAEATSERELAIKIRKLVPTLYDLNRHLFGRSQLEAIRLRSGSGKLKVIRLERRSKDGNWRSARCGGADHDERHMR